MKIYWNQILVLSLLLGLVFSGCKTTKRKNDVSKLGKFYHNTTAKYNGYFNANELVEEATYELTRSYTDNYNQLIPPYKWEGPDNTEPQFSKLDTAIKKVSVVAAIHTPSKWTDDCYLMAAKAQYMKKDYETAENTLLYTINEFDPSNPASRYWEFNRDELKKRAKEEKKEKRAKREEKREEQVKERKQTRKERLKSRKKEAKRRKKARKNRSKAKSREERERLKREAELEKQRQKQEKEAKAIAKANEEAPELKDSEESDGNPLYEPSFDSEEYTKMGHVPAYKEAQLWLARTYIKRDKFFNAQNLLFELLEDDKLKTDLKEKVYVALAEMYIEKDELSEAITNLKNALNVGRKRQQNARYAFLIGQLFEAQQQRGAASNYFADAKKLSNKYEMEFTSDLKSVANSFYAGNINRKESFKVLDNMLSDSKNDEYQGQIYFTKYQIARTSGDNTLANELLRLALRNSGGNRSIALEAYYQLAIDHYDQEDYLSAKYYYDSTMQVMPRDDIRYLPSKRRHDALKKLADAYEVYQEKDSLLALANMDPEKRLELAKSIVAEKKAKLQEELENQSNEASGNTTINPVAGGLESSFFAYDAEKLREGRYEFELEFGDRPLIDNWRTLSSDDILSLKEEAEKQIDEAFDDKNDEEIVKEAFGNFPKTDKEKIAAQQDITSALYDMGAAYREQLNKPGLAMGPLEELVKRFPRSTVDENALYTLVLCAREVNNKDKEEYYIQLLEKRYPKSDYLKMINDPNFLASLQEKQNRVETYYKNNYSEFEQGNYARALTMAQEGVKLYSQEADYHPKFKLLEAMCIGKVEGREKYLDQLRKVSSTYKDSPEATKAREIIRFLSGNKNAFTDTEGQMGDFVFEPDKLHYVLAVIYNGKDLDITKCKIQIADFNKKYFSLKRLVPSNIYLDLNRGIPLIVVRSFDSKKDAMKYYQTIQQYREEFLPEDAKFEVISASQRNYRTILRDRSIESYRPFFEQYYLRGD